jgi:hypothetical protein
LPRQADHLPDLALGDHHSPLNLAGPRLPAHEVQAPMPPINTVDVGMSGRIKERRVCFCPAMKAPRSWVRGIVGFCLDNHASNAPNKQRHADECARDCFGVVVEEVVRQDRSITQ